MFQFSTYLRFTIVGIKEIISLTYQKGNIKYLMISIRICFSGTIYFPLNSLRENTYPVILFMFSKSFDGRKRELYVT